MAAKWQQMAAYWQLKGSGLATAGFREATNGIGLAAKWQQMAAGFRALAAG
jgi:hypothetical protein